MNNAKISAIKGSSTIFLRAVIYLIGLAVAGLCVILLGASVSGNAGMFLPLMLGMLAAAVPFFHALHQGLLLLGYIDKNSAFSELSVRAIRKIKYCAGAISVLYALMMPYILYVSEKDDAPGGVAIGLVLIFAPFVIAVFAAVLERLLQNAIEIKSENDLTV
ncbi:MAG: DUF2975 domain-containing protein [Acidobacteria bacterium]|nr:DUF2975 domain-containing protein [Acidobacteriota bacterium]